MTLRLKPVPFAPEQASGDTPTVIPAPNPTQRVGAPSADHTFLRSSLREQIKDKLLGRIMDLSYPPGSRLVETRIAQELGVSQASVREALRDLEHIGVVVYEPYRGCSVRRVSTAELLEAFPVRAALEALGASVAAERMTAEELDELGGLYDSMLGAARRGDVHDQSQADANFHAAITHGARNDTLERQWSFLEPFSRTFMTVARSGIDLVELTEQHLPILEALRARDGEQAAKAMTHHFTQVADVLRASGGVQDGSG